MVARLVVMGGGRMGEALVAGLVSAGWDGIVVVEKLAGRRDELAGRWAGVTVAEEPVACEGAVVAVKPADVSSACAGLVAAGVGRVLSIAAGVTLGRLEEWLPSVPVVRAMPNTPALVGEGAAAIAAGRGATDDDLAWAEGVLGAVGIVVRVPESLLDAVLVGLPRDVSAQLTVQTLLGAARLLASSDDGPEVLRAAVTSPGGTTAAGLRVLEQQAVRAAFLEAVAAATERSRQLGLG
jgi:pyrroline-5-carboxylate reductase